MTITQLQAFARASLDFAVNCIRETGQLSQQFHLIPHNGDCPHDIMVLGGDITNNRRALYLFLDLLRAKVKADNIEAVVMLSDTFITEWMTEEQAREKSRRGLNVEEAEKVGLCQKHEAVMVVLESPIYQQILRQKYRRNPPESTNVELVGEPEIDDSGTYMTNFNLFGEPQSLDEMIATRKTARKETVQ